jgi:hypothetical protein
MTIDLDRLLRETVHELAAEGRPVDLTGPALRTARRIRTRRLVSAVASVLVLLVGLGFAAVRLGGTDRSYPPAHLNPTPVTSGAPTPSPATTESLPPGSAPVALPGGWLIRAAPAPLGVVMYDNQQGRYRLVTTDERATPSPNGQFLALVNNIGDLTIRRTDDDRELARTANIIRDPDARPVWAPDSSRIAFFITTADTVRVVAMNLDGTQQMSQTTIACPATCTIKWLESGQRLRVYTGSNRLEMTVATGAVGAVSATADDPCGYKVAGYHIDTKSWLCVTASGFAVTAPGGAVSQRVPFPASIDGLGVEGNVNGWVLFRPK